MKATRRTFLAAGAAAAEAGLHAQSEGHQHEHQAVPSDPTLRVKALESLLVEKGLVDPAGLDELIDSFQHKIGPRNGARVVARVGRSRVQAAAARRRTIGYRRGRLPQPVRRPDGCIRKHPQGSQPGGLHAVLLLSVAHAGSAAGLV